MTQPLTFNRLLAPLDRAFAGLPDRRTRPNIIFTMRDAAMAAYSVFFMQSPSFLAHQEVMQETKGHSNAASLFGLERIPSDPQIRNLLDPVPPAALSAPFWDIFGLLEEAGELAAYRSFAGNWLVSLDGTQYFASTKIHCQRCTVTVHTDTTYYAHTAITPVLVAPGEARVIALEPEFIQPQDGHEKQDCERAAGKRWLLRQAQHLAGKRVTLLGDDLYSNQPFCEGVLAQQLNFIFTCKPDSHVALYEEVGLLGRLGAVSQLTQRHWTGQAHEVWTYRYINDVPLRAGPAALTVNWCELTIVQEDSGEQLYHNAFTTNHRLTDATVAPVVAAGRARWKIENENNNVLKNYGYHLEHNFGHGEQYLSMILVLLNLLAFLLHTVLDLCDQVYHRLRDALRVRKTFFNDLKALTRYMLFESWDQMLNFMYVQLELDQPPRAGRHRRKR
jgi:hypothetical protein